MTFCFVEEGRCERGSLPGLIVPFSVRIEPIPEKHGTAEFTARMAELWAPCAELVARVMELRARWLKLHAREPKLRAL